MKLTKEQKAIINSDGNIRINAIAGSGKTTTVIEYAASRPKTAKILYLVFNKSVKTEAIHKFEQKGLSNVKVETAHSLAHRYIVRKHNYKVNQGYKSHDLVPILDLFEDSQRHGAYILANHINKLTAYYCNSDAERVSDLKYLETLTDPKAKGFVSKYLDTIVEKAEYFIERMDKGEIDITHDFYLKKYQLSFPKLNYDYILFDEGQDASAAMLDIFMSQDATKVIVGDTHQQIYSWRYAVNSLEKAEFKTYNLSTSFRFNQDIADLAKSTLDLKRNVVEYNAVSIQGKGNCDTIETKAILARTNLGLLVNAIEYVVEENKASKIYFEGNINSYTYAEDGASLYDVLNLYQEKRHLIRDVLIKGMKDIEDLEDYIKQTEDVQLGLMVEVVKKYGDKIPAIIKEIKTKHINSDRKDEAEIIFSTVHRSKGMEYDAVKLAADFIDKDRIQHLQDEYEGLLADRINEEINLLYVAITRVKNTLVIPENYIPVYFKSSPNIKPITVPVEENQQIDENSPIAKEIQKKYPKAFTPWTFEQDQILKQGLHDGITIKGIATTLERSTKSIRARMKVLSIE
jgi:superfamily I DNA/RNA helicase|tara:strand:+ start:46216 stop:47934 length:1719 start_codon:yes stop_codon:yes gene_type:complete